MGLTYRERRERRAARREEWAEGRERKAEASFAGADAIAEGIPPGQPILVGHHSEKGHRRDLDRIDRGLRKGFEHRNMAKHHRQQAAGIRDQLDRSIYSDDHDAAARLRERIARREARRDRMKAFNRAAAKACAAAGLHRSRRIGYAHSRTDETHAKAAEVLKGLWESLESSDREKGDTLSEFKHGGMIGYPPYALSNLGGNIRRDRGRLATLERKAAERARVAEAMAEEAEAATG